jgi:hypothetical protein
MMNTKTFCFLISLSLVLLIFSPSYAGIPTLGYDMNSGRVFEENGNKWVLWGFEGNIWGCEYGDYWLWERLCQASVYVNANCIVLPVAWLMVEPTQDNYSFTHLDWYLNTAHNYNLKVLIMWAGLGYAAVSIEFCPDYIQNDTATYMRCQGLDNTNVLCPSDPDTLLREKLAYRAVMDHLATINPSLKNIVMGVNIGSELNYMGALDGYWGNPATPTETNRRCTCSYCNAAYTSGQNNIEFMTEQCAKYLAELVDYGAQGYDIPAYTPVCGHKYWNDYYDKGWRYAEDPHVFKYYVAQKEHISNHWVCPSIAETNNAADYILKDLNYFRPSEIPGNTIFVDGIDGGWSVNQPHIELAPWYNILWYGSIGACYWDSTTERSIIVNEPLREKLRPYWGPLKGIHYYLARLKSSGTGVKFWLETDSSQSMNNFTVHQTSSAQDYGVCFEVNPNDLIFTCSTYTGSCTITVTHTGGFDNYRFEKGYFRPLTGQWIKKDDVLPVIAGNDATLTVDGDSGDYMQAVYRYYIYVAGDLNRDGKVDMCDLSILIEDWLTGIN